MDLNQLDIGNRDFPDAIFEQITEIDNFKDSWFSKLNFNSEEFKALEKVATIESIGSSTRIEGSKLSNSEVEELIYGLKAKSFNSRDEQEVAGYAEVMNIVFENHSHMKLSENQIKQLHGCLLKHSVKDEYHRGDYKKFPNHVVASDPDGKTIKVVFETSDPFETVFQMEKLTEWILTPFEGEKLHPLIAIGLFIVVFLAIHPFQDGNGRLSRILTTLLLLQSGYDYVPYSSLESVIEADKSNYYLALRNTQTTPRSERPNWLPWIRFFINSLSRQMYKLIEKQEMQKYQ